MKRLFRNPLKSARAAAAGTLLLGGALLPAVTPSAHAADPYDKNLEARVEALERELNTLSSDSKGKDITTTDVPTFLRASKNVQELTLSGEVRFRDEISNVDGQALNADSQANRLRFRLRLALDYKLNDQFFAGVAIQNAQPADSGNTTFSEGFDNYSVYLWRFFIGWQSKDQNLKVVLGKQPSPFFYETELFWDADISPTGVSESFKLPISSNFDIQLIAGQFIFYDNAENAFYNNPRTLANGTANPNYVEGGNNNTDAYLLDQQLVATFKPTNDLTVTGAAGYFFYPGHGGLNSATATNPGQNGVTAQGGTLANSAAFNSANGTRNLSIATGSGDVKLGLGPLKVKVYGEIAYNFQGGRRDSQEYGLVGYDRETDKFAFATGVTAGSDYTIKKKGDYLLLAEYRQVGVGSIDPNLNDSDFNFSRLGFRGIKAAASYAFEPWLIGTVTYYGSTNLGSEKNLNIGVGNFNASQILQIDLTAKF